MKTHRSPGIDTVEVPSWQPIVFRRLSWVMQLVIFLCLIAGSVQMMWPETPEIFWFGVSALSLVALTLSVRLIIVPEFSTPWSVLAVALSLGYGLGTLNSLVSGYSSGMDLLYLTYSNVTGLGQTVGGILLLMAMMLLAGELDPTKLLSARKITPGEKQQILIMLALLLVAAVGALATGMLGFQTDVADEEGSARSSALGTLIVVAICPVMAASLHIYAKDESRAKLLVYLLCTGLLLVQLTQGRRIFIYTAFVCAIAYFSAVGFRKLLSPKIVIVLIMVAASYSVASKMFYAMRLATWESSQKQSVPELISRGLENMRDSDRLMLDEQVQDNQSRRTFIIGYLAELTSMIGIGQPTSGAIMELGVATAVPTIIWPGKWKIMAQGTEESICHPSMGLPIWDAANTILTSGVCDFGWLGFFGYPLAMAAVFSLLALVFRKYLATVPLYIVCFGIIYSLLSVEVVLAGYFSFLRNLVLLAVFMAVAVGFSRFIVAGLEHIKEK